MNQEDQEKIVYALSSLMEIEPEEVEPTLKKFSEENQIELINLAIQALQAESEDEVSQIKEVVDEYMQTEEDIEDSVQYAKNGSKLNYIRQLNLYSPKKLKNGGCLNCAKKITANGSVMLNIKNEIKSKL